MVFFSPSDKCCCILRWASTASFLIPSDWSLTVILSHSTLRDIPQLIQRHMQVTVLRVHDYETVCDCLKLSPCDDLWCLLCFSDSLLWCGIARNARLSSVQTTFKRWSGFETNEYDKKDTPRTEKPLLRVIGVCFLVAHARSNAQVALLLQELSCVHYRVCLGSCGSPTDVWNSKCVNLINIYRVMFWERDRVINLSPYSYKTLLLFDVRFLL